MDACLRLLGQTSLVSQILGRSEFPYTYSLKLIGDLNVPVDQVKLGNNTNHMVINTSSTAKFSSLESCGLDIHQPIADGPISSGYDKLNGGYKGQSKSDKCTEDLQENNEAIHSSHSQDLKMKALLEDWKLKPLKYMLLHTTHHFRQTFQYPL
ncbi:unnamed protein product [Vicia faba]|uniref:Uncharacterized protein n=1 Tax=Vicia faba TaxID=3906 RepID=A0AAV0Z9V0_VICFA|nr:unnamed protein product [Vicia faba]